MNSKSDRLHASVIFARVPRLAVRVASAGAILAVTVAAVAAGEAYVAGTEPSKRPAGAPALSTFEKPAGWDAAALRGISDPKPSSLKFLGDQGGWYTPFIRPGMTGPYDLRALHAKPLATSQAGKR